MVTQVVELEIPSRPEFVGIARMAVSALAGVRPGLAYERIDDLRIVVSEACTSAIESAIAQHLDDTRVLVRCFDGTETLEVCIDGVRGAFNPVMEGLDSAADDEEMRISLIRALVDEAEVLPAPSGSQLRLVMRRDTSGDDGDDDLLPA